MDVNAVETRKKLLKGSRNTEARNTGPSRQAETPKHETQGLAVRPKHETRNDRQDPKRAPCNRA